MHIIPIMGTAWGDDEELAPIELRPRGRHDPPMRPRRAPVAQWVVLGVLGLLVAAGAAFERLTRVSPDQPEPIEHARSMSAPPSPAEVAGDEPAPVRWHRGAAGPLRPRKGHVATWTGSELVVWGGDPEGDGGAYDVRRGRWRRIAPAPFRPRVAAASAWTGLEVLVWGGREPGAGPATTGGAYDPVRDRWRMLAPSPLTPRTPLGGVWTPGEFIVVGGMPDLRALSRADGIASAALLDGAGYDPAADRWRLIRPMPFPVIDAEVLWTGYEVLVFGTALENAVDPVGAPLVVAAYQPDRDAWRMLPSPPLSAPATAVWTGRELVAWDLELRAAALEVDRLAAWRALPDLPLDFSQCDPRGVMTRRVVFAEHCGQGAVYRPATGRWTGVTHPRDLSAQPIWTGDEVLFWVGRFDGSQDGTWLFRPPGPRPVGPVPPLQAGHAGRR